MQNLRKLGKIAGNIAVQQRINTMHSEGVGYKTISKQLFDEFGEEYGWMSIKRFVDVKKDTSTANLPNEQVNLYVKQRVIDTARSMEKAHNLLWKLLQEQNTTKEFKLDIIKQIIVAIKLCDELSRDFRSLTINQHHETVINNMNGIQGYQQMIEQLNELEKLGDITIHNPKLRRIKNVHEIKDVHAIDVDAEEVIQNAEED
jgi:hypothetical protein